MSTAEQSQDDAYRSAATQYGGAIERLARGYEADAELARDLVQDIHAELWRSFAYFEGQCSVKSWVYRIAHNTAISHVQAALRRKSETLVELDELTQLPAEGNISAETEAREARHRLLAIIHRLKPADRQVMLLYLEDLTALEIGEVTGLSPGAVATRISRLKTVLTDQFASNAGDPA